MAALLIQPGSNDTENRGGGSDGVRCHSQGASPLKAKTGEAPCEAPQGEPLEASRKDSNLVQATRWVYFKMHHPDLDHEGSNDLFSTFQEMATFAGLMGPKVHEFQEVWTGSKDFWATHHVPKGSPKEIHFFCVVHPTKLPKIMGLWEIHSPKALCRQADWPSVWCGKEGQNEATVVNHLWKSHYHLGLMLWAATCSCVSQHWQALMMPEEESNSDDNGKDNFAIS